MKKLSHIVLILILTLVLALTGCGGGNGGGNNPPNQDEQTIKTLFNSIDIDGSSFFCPGLNLSGASLHIATVLTPPPNPFIWSSASYTVMGYTQSLTDITFDSATAAHATANFAVSASYSIGGKTSSSTDWSGSGTLALTGSGTITFVKTNGSWSIDQIPRAIYLKNSQKSPEIGSLVIPATAVTGSNITISGAIVSKEDTALRRGTKAVITGFGGTTNSFPMVNPITAPSSTGNVYGAITVIELIGDGTSSGNYYLNACAYIGLIKIITGS